MATPDTAPASKAIVDEHVLRDLLCVKCKYNLRHQRIDADCPECGTPVAHTTQGHRLVMADPDWLRTIARGAQTLRWAIFLLLFLPVMSVLLLIGALFVSMVNWPAAMNLTLWPVGVVIMWTLAGLLILPPIAGVVLSVIACYWVGQPEPGAGTAGHRQLFARLMIPLALVILPVYFWADVWEVAPEVRLVYLGCVITVAMVGLASALSLLADAIRRVPDDKLADRTKSLARLFPLAVAVLAITAAAVDYSNPSTDNHWEIVHSCAMFVVVPCALMLLATLPGVSRELMAVAAEAQQIMKTGAESSLSRT